MRLVTLAIVVAAVLFGVEAAAVQEQQLPYSGVALTPSGAPVADGLHQMEFRLYTGATASEPVWTELQLVQTRSGSYQVVLGQSRPLPLTTGQQYWLEVLCDGASLGRMPLALLPSQVETKVAARSLQELHLNPVQSAAPDGWVRAGLPTLGGATPPQPLTTTFWALTGNAGTNPNNNFLGTTDNQPLVIRTNDLARVRITTGGQIEVLNSARSVSLGEGAGISQDLTAFRNNVFVGFQAGSATETGIQNVAVGSGALSQNIDGIRNTALGSNAMSELIGGNYNTAIGYGAEVDDGLTNATAIGAFARAKQSNTVVIGSIQGVNGATATANVGIGTTTPTNRLHVVSAADPLRLEGLQVNSALDNVLVVDASGVVKKRSLSDFVGSTAWLLTGNAITGTEFLGTTNAQPLVIRVGNQETFRFNPPGATAPAWSIQRGGGNQRGLHAVDLQSARSAATQVASGDYSVIGGGQDNTASGLYATVGGGYLNTASGLAATVGGGYQNSASGYSATVGGGWSNTASDDYATVGGGYLNTASGELATVGGGYLNTASGDRATVGGGEGNTASGRYSAIPGGYNLQVGERSFGFSGQTSATPTNLSGQSNIAAFVDVDLWLYSRDRTQASQLRFYEAQAHGSGANFVALRAPTSLSTNTTYTLPADLTAGPLVATARILQSDDQGNLSWVSPTALAAATAWALTGNAITSAWNGSSGNFLGTTNAQPLVIATTFTTTPQPIQIWVGNQETFRFNPPGATAPAWSIQRGGGNQRGLHAVDLQSARSAATQVASGDYSVIGGGQDNTASGLYATVGGGYLNTASGLAATVGGGYQNSASGYSATVGGGWSNTASDDYATVGGGYLNTASGELATVGGGYLNTASGDRATVGGGEGNTASGRYSAIPGGYNLQVGERSFGFSGQTSATPTNLSGQSNIAAFVDVDLWLYSRDRTQASQLRFYEAQAHGSGANFVALRAPTSLSTNTTYTLPASLTPTSTVGAGILQTDGSGNLSWVSPTALAAATAWALTGNAITSAWNGSSGNFLGTTNAQPLVIATTFTTTPQPIQIWVGNQETFRFNPPGATAPAWSIQRGGGNQRGLHAVDLQSARSAATQVASGDYSVIGGGQDNTASGLYATVGGGYLNTASGLAATVGGGYQNSASGYSATVGGGWSNTASDDYATVGGGYLNTASGELATVGGGYLNTASGDRATVGGGEGNTASGRYSAIPGGYNLQVGERSFGFSGQTSATPTNLSGQSNIAAFVDVDLWLYSRDRTQASQLRFYEAQAHGSGAEYVAFQAPNTLTTSTTYTLPASLTPTSTVGAGILQTDGSGNLSWVSPTALAAATAWALTGNAITSAWNGSSGNFLGTTNAQPLVIATTFTTTPQPIQIWVGNQETFRFNPPGATAPAWSIQRGGGNQRGLHAVDLQSARSAATQVASGDYSVIGGGQDNTASGLYATVGGGYLNTASGLAATVGGGYQNSASGYSATVGGGWSNTASDDYATVGGGYLNTASGELATVGGGYLNTASGDRATVGGGEGNTASGRYSAIPGGYNLQVGERSFGFSGQTSATPTNLSGQSNIAAFVDVDLWLYSRDRTQASQLRFYEAQAHGSGANFVALRAPTSLSTNTTYTLPASLTPTSTVGAGILQTDGSGNLSWVSPTALAAATAWALTGNAITSAWNGSSGNFLGTTNAQPLVIATTFTTTPQPIQIWVGNQETFRFNPPGATAPAWSIQRGGGNQRGLHAVDLQSARSAATQVASGDYSVIGGGQDNTASGLYATVGGGYLNTASGLAATVGGGYQNSASGYSATVGGGWSNTASDDYATVGGGYLNTASGELATVGGGYLNTASGDRATVGGGEGNTASGRYSAIPGGYNLQVGERSFGFSGQTSATPTNLSGQSNIAAFVDVDLWLYSRDRTQASQLRFYEAQAHGSGAEYVAFQAPNTLTTSTTYTLPASLTPTSTVGAGILQTDGSGNLSWVSPTALAAATAWALTGNAITSAWNGSSGNFLGTTNAQPLVIATTFTTTPQPIQIWVGNQETFRFNPPGATAPAWSIQRGGGNQRGLHAVDLQSARSAATQVASGDYSVIGGGQDNTASGLYATVGGGYLNTASGLAATVGGGYQNSASGYSATVGGGWSNTASDDYATVGGGYLNTASGELATVGGGYLNTASGDRATVGGGEGNTASGDFSVVPGGQGNTANAAYNLVFGENVVPSVTETHRVYFFGDGSTSPSRPSGFLVINRLDGDYPIHVGTNTGNGNGAHLTAGGVWTNGSSRSFKERFVQYRPAEVLERIRQLPVEGYFYKGTEEYHITPMAEDFYRLFGTGAREIIETDSTGRLVRRPNPDVDKYLAASDVAGVALLGVKALDERISTLDPQSTAWALTGNSGTNPTVNFLGTTDAQPLVIRTDNTERMRITATGDVGIGTTAPAATLDVNGTVAFSATATLTNTGSALTLPNDVVVVEIVDGAGAADISVNPPTTGTQGQVLFIRYSGTQSLKLMGVLPNGGDQTATARFHAILMYIGGGWRLMSFVQ
jgi:hypothetical protein